ncbi:hypothetical protein [Lysobacter sp. CA196]|uniref:hypothetical protein n=1 Tax=Lysobacter sp. CA196 TaxID=3455606 RepID=UPI003F8D763D
MSRHLQISRLRARLEREHWPRVQMSLIVLLTGAVGFLASFAMLEFAGLHSMSLRYPLAACCAYLSFLALLWTWARTQGHDAWENLDLPDLGAGSGASSESYANPGGGWQGGRGDEGAGGASASFDAPAASASPVRLENSNSDSDFDLPLADAGDDFAWVLVAIAIALGAAFAAIWVVWIAPGLMAELVLDVALAGGLYRRLRRIESQHWLQTALRRTAIPFLIVALMATAAGYAGARYAPGASSFGDVIAARQAESAP